MSEQGFSPLKLRSELNSALVKLDFTQQTPIQALSLPVILSGKDVTAQAQTGSGKTAAYGIGLLNKLQEKSYFTQALIVCPTRELADQVAEEIRSLAKAIGNVKILVLCGGKPLGPQLASLKREPHIIVGTPGRLLQLLGKQAVSLSRLQTLVLDEADRMLDMGFSEDIDAIISYAPSDRQTLLFSATYPSEIESLSKQYQNNASFVKVETAETKVTIKQIFIPCEKGARPGLIVRVLDRVAPESALVFCNTIVSVIELTDALSQAGYHALSLHGDLEQFKRDQTLIRFSNRSSTVLVATDVAARGLDIKELPLVINFETARDVDIYTHRIGRTGRAGSEGQAISFFGERERYYLKEIESRFDVEVIDNDKWGRGSKKVHKPVPMMATLLISGGRKQKLRAGDLVGTLTKHYPLTGDDLGKIDVLDKVAYVAIRREKALEFLAEASSLSIKNKTYRVRLLR